ncbi:hypothetical protein C5167_036075 [Papaver somniferum]|nr:hypothetical protein C5167_036075 [Papaver somniferum]
MLSLQEPYLNLGKEIMKKNLNCLVQISIPVPTRREGSSMAGREDISERARFLESAYYSCGKRRKEKQTRVTTYKALQSAMYCSSSGMLSFACGLSCVHRSVHTCQGLRLKHAAVFLHSFSETCSIDCVASPGDDSDCC